MRVKTRSMYCVEKTFHFEAAHRLMAPYEGKCLNLHGHSFEVQVRLWGNQLGPEDFLVDFKNLKPIERWIEDHFDHAVLVNEKDEGLLSYLRKNSQRHFTFPHNPTSEIIAQKIFMVTKEIFPNFRVEVVVQETCLSRVIYQELQ